MLSKQQCWRCIRETQQGITCSKCHKAYYCNQKCCKEDQFRHESDCKDMALRFVCRGCGKTGRSMMMCSNCMNAWFCGQDCLKKNYKSIHRDECKRVSKQVKTLAKDMKSVYSRPHYMKVLYYFGNTPAVDLINISMNEGQEYSDPLRLLLCGVGDPRNVCLTISKLHTTHNGVEFVLNDISDCTLARTVLLLYMLRKVGPDKAESVVQVWYSLHLSQQDHELLLSCLQELIEASNLHDITGGTMDIKNQHHLMDLKQVWRKWLLMSRQDNDLAGQRREVFDRPDAKGGVKLHLDEIPRRHRNSMDEWFKMGVLMSKKKRRHARQENVTLTGSTILTSGEFLYTIGSDCLPFCCWDYLDASAAYPNTDDVNELYNQYITDVLNKCAEFLQCSEIHISYLLCSCVDVPNFIEHGLRFDRITTSNLWDYISLTQLFATMKPLLNSSNKSAALITESQNWLRLCPLLEGFKSAQLAALPWGSLRQKILRDTGNQNIAQTMGVVGFKDYISYLEEFTCFVRASLLEVSECKPKALIPSLDQLAAPFGFKARDFGNHGNTISPFRWQLNCRRITMLRGQEFTVEWTLV